MDYHTFMLGGVMGMTISDITAVVLMMVLMFGMVWGGFLYTVRLGILSEKVKATMD